MNPNKENASKAIRICEKIANCDDTETSEIMFLGDFLRAAKRKLPSEASFPGPKSKAKK